MVELFEGVSGEEGWWGGMRRDFEWGDIVSYVKGRTG